MNIMKKDDVGRIFSHSTDDMYELPPMCAGKKKGVSRVPYALSPAIKTYVHELSLTSLILLLARVNY